MRACACAVLARPTLTTVVWPCCCCCHCRPFAMATLANVPVGSYCGYYVARVVFYVRRPPPPCVVQIVKNAVLFNRTSRGSFPHTFVQVYFFRQVARQGTVSIPSLCRAGCPTIVVSHMLWLPTLRASDVHFHVVRSTECSDYVEYNRVKDRLFKPVEIFEVGARK